MTTLITTLSMFADVIGVTGIVPQLVTMLRTRSASGQSPLGWSLGITANLALAFVNALGYHALLLAAGNVLSLAGCLTAVYLVRRYRSPRGGWPSSHAVTEMRTQEFVALADAIQAEQRRRSARWQLAT